MEDGEQDGPPDGSSPLLPAADPDRPVPWRTILATVLVVGGAFLLFELVRELAKPLTWIAVALFFAVVLTPAVDILQRRLRLRRGVATAIVLITGLLLLTGMLYLFIKPIVDNVQDFVDQLPEAVDDAQNGEGWVGELIDRYDLDQWIEENRDRLQESLTSAGKPALDVVRGIVNTIFASVTVLVMTVLMLLRGPQMSAAMLKLIAPRQRERVSIVAGDAARAVSGYMLGNFLISIIAGTSTYVVLKILGVPHAEVLALWVAFADLIPLVGATLGAIPTVGLSFLHSTFAGLVALGFYIVYQQFENHVLQPSIMSRTVNVNPLAVLFAVLAGVELFGFLGALLAIPVAGVLQVIARSVYDERLGRWKDEPTIGVAERPVTETRDAD
jgi:predicted PurR-regulated permease PerM